MRVDVWLSVVVILWLFFGVFVYHILVLLIHWLRVEIGLESKKNTDETETRGHKDCVHGLVVPIHRAIVDKGRPERAEILPVLFDHVQLSSLAQDVAEVPFSGCIIVRLRVGIGNIRVSVISTAIRDVASVIVDELTRADVIQHAALLEAIVWILLESH